MPGVAHGVGQDAADGVAQGAAVGAERDRAQVGLDAPVAAAGQDGGGDGGDGFVHDLAEGHGFLAQGARGGAVHRQVLQVVREVEQVGGAAGDAGGVGMGLGGEMVGVAMQRHADTADVVRGEAEATDQGLLAADREAAQMMGGGEFAALAGEAQNERQARDCQRDDGGERENKEGGTEIHDRRVTAVL